MTEHTEAVQIKHLNRAIGYLHAALTHSGALREQMVEAIVTVTSWPEPANERELRRDRDATRAMLLAALTPNQEVARDARHQAEGQS
jgi:hypothetical protein